MSADGSGQVEEEEVNGLLIFSSSGACPSLICAAAIDKKKEGRGRVRFVLIIVSRTEDKGRLHGAEQRDKGAFECHGKAS